VKIDKSFVIAMPNDRDSEVIVRSTIEMVHNIGLTVVAEGTESQVVCRQLEALGADVVQGIYISPPMPSEDFRAWAGKGPWGSPPAH
jgi:EAL domain-containing protein (putative c-di-GMP-specific phosphodiesterase class I)